jgi:hypothetical protein
MPAFWRYELESGVMNHDAVAIDASNSSLIVPAMTQNVM